VELRQSSDDKMLERRYTRSSYSEHMQPLTAESIGMMSLLARAPREHNEALVVCTGGFACDWALRLHKLVGDV